MFFDFKKCHIFIVFQYIKTFQTDYFPRKRGGHVYKRPWRCIRYGVKVILNNFLNNLFQVLGKYEDDKWLGIKGVESADEWAVAYHGTMEINVLDILKEGFLLSKGKRFAYGKGIYCSPQPNTALAYGQNYTFNVSLNLNSFKIFLRIKVIN